MFIKAGFHNFVQKFTILAEWPITADFGSKKLEDMGGQGVVEGSRGGSPQSTLY